MVDGRSLGTYTYEIHFFDTTNNTISDTVVVTVSDSTTPTTTAPANINYNEGTTGNNITWTGTDTNADYYRLYLDGVKQGSDITWTSGVDVVIDVDGLPLGTYTYVIHFFDTTNNTISDTVLVTVSDATNPTTTSPTDVGYSEGTTGNNITWTGTDTNADYYRLYLKEML